MSNYSRSLKPSLFFLIILLVGCGPAAFNQTQADTESTKSPLLPTAAPTVTQSTTSGTADTVNVEIEDEDHVAVEEAVVEDVNREESSSYFLGSADAPITIVEYSDFQCPFCQRHTVQTLPLLKEQFIDTGRLRYEFRDFPIASLHPFAYRLHEAAHCAGEVDGDRVFWQAHELFFAQADLFKVDSVDAMNSAIAAAFAQNELPDVADCLLAGRFAERVEKNVAEGEARGVSGTPSFFIGDFKIAGAQPFEAFASAIVAAEEGRLAEHFNPTPVPQAAAVQAAAPTPAVVEPRPKTGLGDSNASVTIVEFSDYQCPFCQRHALQTMPQLQQLIDDGRVYYEFKDFPIASLHPLAYKLHEAALCVQDYAGTDAYWKAHDLFFGRSDVLNQRTEEDMDTAIATELNRISMWPNSVATCYGNRQFAGEVEANIVEGTSLGVSGTPSFFINGYPLVGAQPYQTFEAAIALAEEGRLAEALRPQQQANTPQQPAPSAGQPIDVPLSGNEPTKGADNAPVTIIEYSSYQCPFCKRHFDQTMPLIQPYIDDGTVRYIFKDFPLPSQPQAFKVHEAAHCAHEQGGDDGYWAIHDIMFRNQAVWSSTAMGAHVDVIKELVKTADFIDGNAFDTCLDEGHYSERVNADLQEGSALNVRGTPSFFINGQFISGAQPFAVFQQAIEAALQQ